MPKGVRGFKPRVYSASISGADAWHGRCAILSVCQRKFWMDKKFESRFSLS